MKRFFMSFCAVPMLAVICFSSVQANNAGTPPGSFVRQRAVSVRQLVQQVRNDSVVRQRYAKHFGIPSQVVADYLDRNLKLVSLKKPLRATVWYVSRTGAIHTKTKLLPKGTAVFVDKTGRPVIIWSCGNPLSRKLIKPAAEKEQVKAAPIETLGTEPVEEVLAPPVVETPTTIEEILQPAQVEIAAAPPAQIIPDNVVTPVPAVAIAELPAISIGGATPLLNAALVLTGSVPIIGSIIGGGDSGKGGGGGDQSVVPEVPGSLVIMAGLGALGVLRRVRFNRIR